MNSRSLVNLFLLVLLISFAIFYYYRGAETLPPSRLTSLDMNNIERILIPRDNGGDILLVKQVPASKETQWQMKKPYDIEAHPFRIKTLLSITQLVVDNYYATADLKLEDYALLPPRARIVFNDTEIAFGKTNPVNNKRYLMADNFISLHLDQSYPLVSAQATSFINLSLLSNNQSITEIQLPHMQMHKADNNSWITKPANHLTKEQIEELLNNWKNAQAFAVHKYLPRKQLGKIRIVTQTGEIIFDITDDDPWLILGRHDLGIEYHLDSSLKARLLGEPDA